MFGDRWTAATAEQLSSWMVEGDVRSSGALYLMLGGHQASVWCIEGWKGREAERRPLEP